MEKEIHRHIYTYTDRQIDRHVYLYIYIHVCIYRFLQQKRETLGFLPSGSDALLGIGSSSGSAVMALFGRHLLPSLP